MAARCADPRHRLRAADASATAATPTTWCRSISNTGWSGGSCRVSCRQGFQSSLSRVSVIEGPGAQPRVVLMGRLAVYGAGAARLHEEIIPVTAIWTEAERDAQAASAAWRERRGEDPQSARGGAARCSRRAEHGRQRALQALDREGHCRSRADAREGSPTSDSATSGYNSPKRGEDEARSLAEPARTAAHAHRQGG